jgi:hypothetical protein
VGHVRHGAGRRDAGAGRVHRLEDEPGAQHDPRGQAQRQEDQERDEDPDPGPRVEHQIRAQDAGDRTRRADQRVAGVGVDEGEAVRRRVAAGHVEQHVADVAEAVLDVVAEDHQEQHVAEQVQPAAVQEHRREDRHRGRLVVAGRADEAARALRSHAHVTGGDGRRGLAVDQLPGHRRPVVQERLEVAQLGRAALAGDRAGHTRSGQEHHEVGGDQRVRHIRRATDRVHVMDGDDHGEILPGFGGL